MFGSGTLESIIEGRQILLKLFYDLFTQKIDNIGMSNIFKDSGLDDFYANDVAADYMILSFLELIYTPSSIRDSSVIDTDYIKIIKEALINNAGVIRLGSTEKGVAPTKNPLFDATDLESNKRGLDISIDLTKFTPEILQKIIWTLQYDAMYQKNYQSQFNNIRSIENIKNKIRDPIIKLYTNLYNIMMTYKDGYYYDSPYSTSEGEIFYVSLYRPSLGGMAGDSSISQTTEASKNMIKLDANNPSEFSKSLASVVFYMVKYSATIQIKQGWSSSPYNVFYGNLLEVLDEGYMKQSFYEDAKNIGGSLYHGDKNNNWPYSNAFQSLVEDYNRDAFTFDNFFPIRKFSDADEFDECIIILFNSLGGTYAGFHNSLSDLKPRDLL